MGIQSFGENFDRQKFYHARNLAKEITLDLSAKIRPGMVEADAHRLYQELCKKSSIQKQWHPPKLRFGPNTIKNFKEESVSHVLQEEDIFFIDIGPIIDGHEADYGETFTIGHSSKQKLIAEASKKIFFEVRDQWLKSKVMGEELYHFAKARGDHHGYILNMESDGHRIGDFPHHIFFKGGLNDCEEIVVPDAWILEIHLWDRTKNFGAFYEDILTDGVLS